ncbi:MAG: hypothetical protein AB7F66_14765 [Bacteriovoracia bacterium]
MKQQLRGIVQVVALCFFAYFLVRLFPLVIRLVEASAMGIRQLWWAVLIVALGGWLIWVFRSRNSG